MFSASAVFLAFIAAALAAPGSPTTSGKPATTSVMTPHGLRHPDNVHEVPAGGRISHIDDEIHLLDANGNVIHRAKHTPSPASSFRRQEQTGRVGDVTWTNDGTPISQFSATWTVPPPPASQDGQLLYWFNAIVDGDDSAMLQPVLQWGVSPAGGGSYFSVANWYVTGSNSYYSTLSNTTTGTQLTGIMTMIADNQGSYNWVSQFTYGSQYLPVENTPLFKYASLSLEAYGVQSDASFPTGSTTFGGVHLEVEGGSTPDMNWTVDTQEDGLQLNIDVQGADSGQATVVYPLQ